MDPLFHLGIRCTDFFGVRKSAGESCIHALTIYQAYYIVCIASDFVYRASGFIFTLFIRLHRVVFGRRVTLRHLCFVSVKMYLCFSDAIFYRLFNSGWVRDSRLSAAALLKIQDFWFYLPVDTTWRPRRLESSTVVQSSLRCLDVYTGMLVVTLFFISMNTGH